jgi:nitrite reductase/ring-hydroxylating ferredoxin subunit
LCSTLHGGRGWRDKGHVHVAVHVNDDVSDQAQVTVSHLSHGGDRLRWLEEGSGSFRTGESMPVKGLKRNIFQRIFGICRTRPPLDPECWTFEGDAISVDLSKAPEVAAKGGAIRLEGRKLPKRVLLFRGDDDALHAFENACAHMKRRVDPVPGEGILQCCSINAAVYDYSGKKVEGPGEGGLRALEIVQEGGKAVIRLA